MTASSTTSSGRPPVELGTTAWRNAIFVIFALSGIALASWVSRLPAVRDALELRIDEVGILIFAIAAGSIVGLVGSSHLIARIGAKPTMLAGVLVIATGLTVAGVGATLGPNFWLAFAGLVFLGAALGITDVAMNVSGAANERALGRTIMPVFHAFFSFGTMFGAGMGALAEFLGLPIALHLGVIAVILAAAAIAAYRFIQVETVFEADGSVVADDDHSRSWRGRLSIWRDPRTLLIGLVVLAAAFSEGSANDWLALAMVDGHGFDNTGGALIFGVFVTAMTVARLGGVFLLDRFGRVAVLRASFLLAASGLIIIIFVPNPVAAIIGVTAWGLGSALGFPVGMSAAADDPKTAAARVSAVATIGYFAFLVGPPVIGILGQQVGLLGALLTVLVLCALGSLVASAARKPLRTSTAASAAASAAASTAASG